MSDPIVADVSPTKVRLKARQYYFFCSCGRSKDQPFCDGEHKGTDILPLTFKCETETEAWLCQCKLSGNLPYCDGSHKQCGQTSVGKPVTAFTRT